MSHQSELIASDIDAYLKQHENKELLRFITCGSVDDGKSTLIGRLLHDSKMIYEDQLASLHSDSKRLGSAGERLDLALLVDGLQAEREQGITIDVAYRYFSTAQRKFIIADTPGHEQYTRNMATGASTADLAIILIDARHGIQTQTRRHSFIVSLLGIRHTVIAVNKMDLVDFDEQVYQNIVDEYRAFSKQLNLEQIHFLPISALDGDNVVNRSERTPWYQGEALMPLLETVKIQQSNEDRPLRFPVQYVNRPDLSFRGYAGTLASGAVKVGDRVKALPSGKTSTVKTIETWEGQLASAASPQAITLTLSDEIDVSRGDMLVAEDSVLEPTRLFRAQLVWMSETPLFPGRELEVKLSTLKTAGRLRSLERKIDVNTLEAETTSRLDLNEIGEVLIDLDREAAVDRYEINRSTGSFILIDRLTNATLAAGMILDSSPRVTESSNKTGVVTAPERSRRTGIKRAALVQIEPSDPLLIERTERALFESGVLAIREANPTTARALVDLGFLVLCSGPDIRADWKVGSDNSADLYLDSRLPLNRRSQLIVEGLRSEGII